jgi:gliding motility-associated lipoprotein GldD
MSTLSPRAALLCLLLPLLCLTACGDETPLTPKPRGYPRVVYPEKAYRQFISEDCPFTFEYPVYARIEQDTAFFDERPSHPCWFDVYLPDFDSRIHSSYYDIGGLKSFERLQADAFEMADWHNKRANYIDEIRIDNPEHDVYGFAFSIEGPAASTFQFYLTDSTDHFLRCALYFNARAQPDSLAPFVDFVHEDIEHMIGTFRWTN